MKYFKKFNSIYKKHFTTTKKSKTATTKTSQLSNIESLINQTIQKDSPKYSNIN